MGAEGEGRLQEFQGAGNVLSLRKSLPPVLSQQLPSILKGTSSQAAPVLG